MLNFNISPCVIEAIVQIVDIVLEGHGLYIPKHDENSLYRIAAHIEATPNFGNVKAAADVILDQASFRRRRQPIGKIESYAIAVEIARIYKLFAKGE